MRGGGPLEVEGLEVRYGDLVAVREVSLTVSPGEVLAVTGPSGAGKSSLLWALAGATAYAGSVRVAGEPVVDRTDAAARGIVLLPQGNGLATVLTAEENILVPLVAAGLPTAEARERVTGALETVGLEESRRHLVEELSGGQQQRIAVARSLALRGLVLLVDEPTSDLDAANRDRVMRALRAEADAGAVVVVATHDPEAAARADAEIALDEGRMTWPRGLGHEPGRHRQDG